MSKSDIESDIRSILLRPILDWYFANPVPQDWGAVNTGEENGYNRKDPKE